MKLIIIGPMASGKSVVGRKLSKKLGLQFFDTDEEIERSAGASMSWIFDVEGEAKFREREYQVLNKIIHGDKSHGSLYGVHTHTHRPHLFPNLQLNL